MDITRLTYVILDIGGDVQINESVTTNPYVDE